MRPLSKSAEAKLLVALERIADLVNTGSDPNSAIIKVARDQDLPSGHIQLIVTAYNTGATTSNRETGDNTLEKAADFRLADASEILDNIFPKIVKTSAEIVRERTVSTEYALPPTGFITRRQQQMEKAAASAVPMPEKTWVPPPRDAREIAKRAYSAKVAARREAEDARGMASAAYQKAGVAMDALAEYFMTPHNCSFSSVKRAAEIQLSSIGTSVLTRLAAVYPHFTKQSEVRGEILKCGQPIKLIENIVGTLEQYNTAQKKADVYIKQAEPPERESPNIITHSVLYDPAAEPLQLKKADGLETIPTGPVSLTRTLGQTVWSGTGSYIPQTDAMKTDAFKDITDPDHDRKLRGIRAQGVLADLITNDPIISGHDPREVATAFNELAEVAPSFMDSSATVQALLRKRLESGQLADFDIKQLVDMEKVDAERRKNVLDAKERELKLI